MKDKIVVITGASSGIGLATARELARQGALVVMVCRDAERAQAARKEVAAAATGPEPTVFLADLLSQREIRRVATESDFFRVCETFLAHDEPMPLEPFSIALKETDVMAGEHL